MVCYAVVGSSKKTAKLVGGVVEAKRTEKIEFNTYRSFNRTQAMTAVPSAWASRVSSFVFMWCRCVAAEGRGVRRSWIVESSCGVEIEGPRASETMDH
jgi:hypothetical protein